MVAVTANTVNLELSTNTFLFTEVARLRPRVVLDDYFRNGVWQREELLIDIELLQAHDFSI